MNLEQPFSIENREVDKTNIGNLIIKVGFMFTLNLYRKGEFTNWQFDWGGRL